MKLGTSCWYIARFLAIGVVMVLPAPEKAGGQPPCGTIVDPPIAVVFAVEAAGLDIAASLAWDGEFELPPGAELVVRDALCNIVGVAELVPAPDVLILETVSDALRKVSKHGLKYQITIELDRQAALSRPYYFQVGLDCPADEVCAFSLLGGIFSDGIFLTEELDQILDEVAAEDPENVLGAVIELRPDLRGEVYALAAQLSHLDKQIHFSRPKGCDCLWTTPVGSPRRDVLHQIGEGNELKAVTGLNIPGGPLYLGAGTVTGLVSFEAEGKTTTSVKLRCQEIDSWTPLQLDIAPTTSTLKFRFPAFRFCESGCGGEVIHDLHFSLDMEALVDGESPGATSHAAQFVEYSVDGESLFSSIQSVVASSGPAGPPADSLMFMESASATATAPSSAQFLILSGIAAVAESPTFAFAESINAYTLRTLGTASCAEGREVSLFVRGVGLPVAAEGIVINRTNPCK